jgi:hypothetical protein
MTRSGLVLFVVALLLAAPAARTAPLDKEGCAKLKAEEAQLEQSGVRASMSRGPEWAKTNLAADKLEQIRRLIEVEEQLLFRCHGKPLVNLPQDPDPDPAAREPESKEGTAGAKAAKAAKQPKKKAAAAKQAPGEAKAEAPAKAEAAKAAAPKAPAPPKAAAPAKPAKDAAEKPVVAKAAKKAKAKDDAYRPPAAGTEPGANPFSKQQ